MVRLIDGYTAMTTALRQTMLSPARSGGGNPKSKDDILVLLANATATLDSDVARAREFINRAASLLAHDGTPGYMAPPKKGGLGQWQIERVKRYIEDRLSGPLQIKDLAALVHLSASHFSRSFHTSFGERPSAYILRRRMEHAKQMMLLSDMPLCEVALACGMCDQAHFTRTFRRITGTSPNAWRRHWTSAGMMSSG